MMERHRRFSAAAGGQGWFWPRIQPDRSWPGLAVDKPEPVFINLLPAQIDNLSLAAPCQQKQGDNIPAPGLRWGRVFGGNACHGLNEMIDFSLRQKTGPHHHPVAPDPPGRGDVNHATLIGESIDSSKRIEGAVGLDRSFAAELIKPADNIRTRYAVHFLITKYRQDISQRLPPRLDRGRFDPAAVMGNPDITNKVFKPGATETGRVSLSRRREACRRTSAQSIFSTGPRLFLLALPACCCQMT